MDAFKWVFFYPFMGFCVQQEKILSIFSSLLLSFSFFFLSWLQNSLQCTQFISDGWHLSAPSEVTGLDFLSSPLSLSLNTSFPNKHQQTPDHTICSALLLPTCWQENWQSLNPRSLSPRIHACWSRDDLLRADERLVFLKVFIKRKKSRLYLRAIENRGPKASLRLTQDTKDLTLMLMLCFCPSLIIWFT